MARLMVLRHTAALAGDRQENWNAFRKLTVFPCTSRPQSEILEHIHGEAPW